MPWAKKAPLQGHQWEKQQLGKEAR